MPEADPPNSAQAQIPARTLGAADAMAIVVGAIIGVGIFFNPSRVVALTGGGGTALIAWGFGGVIALCGALVFAELGRRYHASGAQYQVLRDAWGPFPAFLFVFCNATAIQAGVIGIIAMVCVKHLAAMLGLESPTGAAALGLATLLIVGVVAANAAGVKWGSRLQNITVLAKVLTLLAVTLIAALWGGQDVTWHEAASASVGKAGLPSASGGVIGGITAALVPAFFAYGGWQHALWISGEVRQPARNLPRAILGGVLLVVVVYLLANWAYLRLLGAPGVAESKTLASDAVAAVFPGWAGRAVAAAVAVSAFGVLNAQLLSGPRLVYGMAADGKFFRPFGVLSGRFGTPIGAILLLGGMGLALLWSVGPDRSDRWLLTGLMFIDGLFFALTGAAMLVLRRRGAAGTTAPSADGAIPGSAAAAVVFVIGEIGVMAGAYMAPDARAAAFVGAAWVVGAAIVYAIWFRGERR